MSDILPAANLQDDSRLVQTVTSEARAIVNATPSTPGPFSLFTFDRILGEINELADLPAFQDRHYPPGRYISERGQVPERIFVVVRGLAMLEGTGDAAGEYIARLLQRGEVVGLVEALANRRLRYYVIASTDCTVRSIDRKDLLLHMAEHPETRLRVIRLLAECVRDADRLLKSL